jgi:gamma-glutamyltranspeptidase
LLAPAISLARDGFSMGAVATHSIINNDLLHQPGFKETYVDPVTPPPQIGDAFKNRDLAATLHQVPLPHDCCCVFSQSYV